MPAAASIPVETSTTATVSADGSSVLPVLAVPRISNQKSAIAAAVLNVSEPPAACEMARPTGELTATASGVAPSNPRHRTTAEPGSD